MPKSFKSDMPALLKVSPIKCKKKKKKADKSSSSICTVRFQIQLEVNVGGKY